MRRNSALAAFVLALLAAAPAHAAWPGDNGRVLFTSANRLYTMDPAGGPWTRLVNRNEQQAQAAWSPDGSKIAYRVGPDGDTEIWVVNADGSNPHQITTTPNVAPCDPCYSSQPAWSPDGTQMVFRTDRGKAGGDGDVWTMNSDGGNPRPLVTSSDDQRYPALSPDGTRLVYRSGDPPEIFVAHADGTSAVQITHNSLFDSAPAWAPDSSRLAFERGDPGADVPSNASYPSMEIWTMAPDGSDQRQVTSNTVHDEGPAWAPDGSGQILFTRDDKTNSDLYIGERRLTDASTLEESPDWQAIPRAAAAQPTGGPPSGGSPATPGTVTITTAQRAELFALRTTRSRVSRTGRFVVRLRCTARCSGTLRVSRHGTTLARTRFATPSARTLNVRLRLKASTLRRLRRAGRLGVEVRLLHGRLTLLAPR